VTSCKDYDYKNGKIKRIKKKQQPKTPQFYNINVSTHTHYHVLVMQTDDYIILT